MSYETVYCGGNESPISIMQAFFSELSENDDTFLLDLNKIDIHKKFYDKLQGRNSLKDFYFNGNPKFPFSQQIEDVLYEMTVCGMLTRPNPTMVKYNFIAIDRSCFSQLNPETQNIISEIVKTVKSALIESKECQN